MTPKVSIIIPVYNVEKYLRECLDSVVNQTLRDIEIICIDDGSPDGSPQILEEYAAKDSRIIVIHKKNGGLSSARNAAYPYIKGEYTLFVDSDDWIERDLCEKAVVVADKKNADMTFFLYFRNSKFFYGGCLENYLKHHAVKEVGLKIILQHMNAWSKIWRTNFLLKENLVFPQGIYFEDLVIHWKALSLNPKISILPEYLYCYRVNHESIMLMPSVKWAEDIFRCFEIIKNNLHSSRHYQEEWKELYLWQKLLQIGTAYYSVPCNFKKIYCQLAKDTIGEDECNFLKQANDLPPYVKIFFNSLNGTRWSQFKLNAYTCLIGINKSFPLISKLRHTFQR